LKTINYKNPAVASYLFFGAIFFILGFTKGLPFLLIGALSIYCGIKENNKVS
jgi:hypothetical protein